MESAAAPLPHLPLPAAAADAASGGEAWPGYTGAQRGTSAPSVEALRHHRNQAVDYVIRVKRRFIADPAPYRTFLGILDAYHRQPEVFNVKEVIDRLAVLFRDHDDLLRVFMYFVPDHVQDAASVCSLSIATSRFPWWLSACGLPCCPTASAGVAFAL